ncbi:MAG TPA: DnaJ C-terminal domain-containing protein [Roseiarcus sp.]|nr:DnaJ C-terminal domain-containing protein [Roseiarcus sp.]
MRAAARASRAFRLRTCSAASISATFSAASALISEPRDRSTAFSGAARRARVARTSKSSWRRRSSGFSMAEETVHVAHPAVCHACGGTGAKENTKPRTCPKCGGAGQLVRSQRKQGVTLQQITTCPDCGGRGAIIDSPCPECAGTGRVTREETLKVRIPVGIEDGTVLRVAGHGLPADKPGAPPGDLFVVIRTAGDPRFERRGSDLYRTETIDVVDAVLGVSIVVPLLDGQQSVDIPAGAQPDTILRLDGKGLPSFGAGHRGDLYIRLQVHVPEQLSDRQRELFEQLRAINPAKQASLDWRGEAKRTTSVYILRGKGPVG